MPFYHKLGKIPHKRHTVFSKPKGGIYYEQLFGTVGFDGMSSLLYHTHRPTMVKDIIGAKDLSPKIAADNSDIAVGWSPAGSKSVSITKLLPPSNLGRGPK